MKKSNIALGISIGFVAIAVASCFCEMSMQVLPTLSISSLLFTISQTITSFLETKAEENQKRYEAFKSAGAVHLDEKWELFFLQYLNEFSKGKKEKWLTRASSVLEVLAFVILVLGLTIPLNFLNYGLFGEMSTFLSFAILFFNIWLMEFSRMRIKMWSELQLFNMLLKDTTSGDKTEA